MTNAQKNDRLLEVQTAYAAGTMDRAAARAELLKLVGNEDHADEILGQIDGEDDVIELSD